MSSFKLSIVDESILDTVENNSTDARMWQTLTELMRLNVQGSRQNSIDLLFALNTTISFDKNEKRPIVSSIKLYFCLWSDRKHDLLLVNYSAFLFAVFDS